jgi:hypothetical protein
MQPWEFTALRLAEEIKERARLAAEVEEARRQR